jgi:hypothetical protein
MRGGCYWTTSNGKIFQFVVDNSRYRSNRETLDYSEKAYRNVSIPIMRHPRRDTREQLRFRQKRVLYRGY